jgi:uncharacterized membrane protein YcaP (DUF421 family)
MDLARIAVRALIAYIYLLVMERATGKRVIGEATPFDFVVALIIGDLADDALWAEVSMTRFGAAIGSIISIDIVVSTIACRSAAFLRLVNGRPVIVLREGARDGDELRREKLNDADLAHLLRIGGIEKRRKVRMAMMDRGPHLSILRYWKSTPLQKKDREAVQ